LPSSWTGASLREKEKEDNQRGEIALEPRNVGALEREFAGRALKHLAFEFSGQREKRGKSAIRIAQKNGHDTIRSDSNSTKCAGVPL